MDLAEWLSTSLDEEEKIERRGKVFYEIIGIYNKTILNIDKKAKTISSNTDRAYGGIIRAGKGALTPFIVKKLIVQAWEELGGDPKRLFLTGKRIKAPIKIEYIHQIKYPIVRNKILQEVNKYFYGLPPDILVNIDIDLEPKMYIECKAYTENAMLKRILFDCAVAKRMHPDILFMLFQLESHLGGDYKDLKKESETVGSYSTRAILSLSDIDLRIVTLLKGERSIQNPIHKKFKPLEWENLEKILEVLKLQLKNFL